MKRDVSTSTIGRDEARRPLMEAYMFQRRLLLGCSMLMVISLIIWIVAISTDHWIIISGGTGIFIPESRRFFMSSHSGLWRHCRNTIVPNALTNAQVVRNFSSMSYTSQTNINDAKRNLSHMDFVKQFAEEKLNETDSFTESARRRMFAHWARERCKYIDMFPNSNTLRNEPGFDDEVMDYIRTQASFACITLFVMSLGAVFSFYTFMNPRYMFKRLAGGIHLVAASTALVVIQVLFSSIDYTKDHLFYAYPDGAELTYGYGVYLAWFTFVDNIFCGLMFLWYSGKKKGAKAPNDEVAMADEPTIMGR
ncbi:GL16795 [Drosophila persimilis]|uniref:GL16795 n=1 Tax=Drosophila persimilis TaxID=7234 RepID=B4GI98_DROPE|nr:GL16795 [Drosophila persimilis]